MGNEGSREADTEEFVQKESATVTIQGPRSKRRGSLAPMEIHKPPAVAITKDPALSGTSNPPLAIPLINQRPKTSDEGNNRSLTTPLVSQRRASIDVAPSIVLDTQHVQDLKKSDSILTKAPSILNVAKADVPTPRMQFSSDVKIPKSNSSHSLIDGSKSPKPKRGLQGAVDKPATLSPAGSYLNVNASHDKLQKTPSTQNLSNDKHSSGHSPKKAAQEETVSQPGMLSAGTKLQKMGSFQNLDNGSESLKTPGEAGNPKSKKPDSEERKALENMDGSDPIENPHTKIGPVLVSKTPHQSTQQTMPETSGAIKRSPSEKNRMSTTKKMHAPDLAIERQGTDTHRPSKTNAWQATPDTPPSQPKTPQRETQSQKMSIERDLSNKFSNGQGQSASSNEYISPKHRTTSQIIAEDAMSRSDSWNKRAVTAVNSPSTRQKDAAVDAPYDVGNNLLDQKTFDDLDESLNSQKTKKGIFSRISRRASSIFSKTKDPVSEAPVIDDSLFDLDEIIAKLLSSRGVKAQKKALEVTKGQIEYICRKCHEIVLAQPNLLELAAPVHVAGKCSTAKAHTLRRYPWPIRRSCSRF